MRFIKASLMFLATAFAKTRSFLENTVDEMKKSVWPARDQLFESTLLVLIVLLVLTVYVWGLDTVIMAAIKSLISA